MKDITRTEKVGFAALFIAVVIMISFPVVFEWRKYQEGRKNRDYEERSTQSELEYIETTLTKIKELEAGTFSLEKQVAIFQLSRELERLSKNAFEKNKEELANRGHDPKMSHEKMKKNGLLLAQKIWENPDDIYLLAGVEIYGLQVRIWFESPISTMEFVAKLLSLIDANPEEMGLSWRIIKQATFERTVNKIQEWRGSDFKNKGLESEKNLLELQKAALWYYDPVSLGLSQEELLRISVSLQVDKSDDFANIREYIKTEFRLHGNK
jgi:hypothetical protein